jgi:hypothetical protein
MPLEYDIWQIGYVNRFPRTSALLLALCVAWTEIEIERGPRRVPLLDPYRLPVAVRVLPALFACLARFFRIISKVPRAPTLGTPGLF